MITFTGHHGKSVFSSVCLPELSYEVEISVNRKW